MLGPLEYHEKHHAVKNTIPKIETCKKCVVAKAKCLTKKVYKDRKTAHKEALKINVDRNWFPDSCMFPYRCRYCDKYHLTTAVRSTTLRKVDKMHRSWVRKTKQKKSLWEYSLTSAETSAVDLSYEADEFFEDEFELQLQEASEILGKELGVALDEKDA